MNGDLSLNQKIASALSPLVEMKLAEGEEENLKKLFFKVQEMMRKGMEPEKLERVGSVLRMIAQEEQEAHPSFFQIMNVFESRVGKSSGLSPSLYPFFIHLSEQYDFAVKDFVRKKEVVCSLLGIDPKDPSVRSNKVDKIIFDLREGSDLETLVGKVLPCIPSWMSGQDRIVLLGQLTSLESQDQTILLLEQILPKISPQPLDVERFFSLLLPIVPTEGLQPLIDAIFRKDDPNIFYEGLKVLEVCARYQDNPSVACFLPLLLEKEANISSIEWESVGDILADISDIDFAKEAFSLVSTPSMAISRLMKEPELAAAVLVKLEQCCDRENLKDVLFVINYMLIVRPQEDLQGLQDSFCRAIECLSKILNGRQLIEEGFVYHFCRDYKQSFAILPPDQQSAMIAEFAKIDPKQREDVLQGIISLDPDLYLEPTTVCHLGNIKPFTQFVETIRPCFANVIDLKEKQRMMDLLSRERDLRKLTRVAKDFQRIQEDRASFYHPVEALFVLCESEDPQWCDYLIRELSSLQHMSSDEMISVLQYLQPLHSCVSKGIYCCKLSKKFFSECGFVSMKFMQVLSALSMEDLHSFKHVLDKLFSFYPVSSFGEEKKFLTEKLLEVLPSSYPMFIKLFEHIVVESPASEGFKTIDRLVALANGISDKRYEDLFSSYIRNLPTEESKIELLEAYLANPEENWREILALIQKIEVARDVYHPTFLIEEILKLSKEHSYEKILDISLPWSGFNLPNLSIERKMIMLRRLLSVVSDSAGYLIPRLKRAFIGIDANYLPQFMDDFFSITEKMDYETFLKEKGRYESSYMIIFQPLVMKLLLVSTEYRLSQSLEHILVNIGKLHLKELDLIPQIARYFDLNYQEDQIKEIWEGLVSKGAPTSFLSHLIFEVFVAAVEADPNKAVDYEKVKRACKKMINIATLWPFTIKGEYKKHLAFLAPIFLRMCSDFIDFSISKEEFLGAFITSAFNEIDTLFERGVTEKREKNIALTRGVFDFIFSNQSSLSQSARELLQSKRSLIDQAEKIYGFYDHLKEVVEEPLFVTDCTFRVNPTTTAAFNPNAFVEIMQSKVLSYGELPSIDRDILANVFDRMRLRFAELGINDVEQYLKDHGVIGEQDLLIELEDNIKSKNKEIYKASHIGIPIDEEGRQKIAPAHVEKVFTILKEVMDLSDEVESQEIVSAQEYRVLLIASFLRNCPTGQKEGLFQLNLFLEQFREHQTPKSFLSEEITGESSLLDREEKVLPKERFVESYLRSTFALQCSVVNELITNNNSFTRELISDDRYFTQMVHQSLYLKNLLGKNLGLQNSIAFDPYIEWIDPLLRSKSKYEVMQIFCKHYGPLFFAKVKEDLNGALSKNYEPAFNQINSIIEHVEENMWSEDYKELTDEGVAALLRGLQILAPNSD